MNKVNAFLSYNTKDKKIAGRIKKQLEGYGLSVFLAHEDIKPSAEWQEKIVAHLKTTEVFLPLLTENFAQSKWTDQETGFALSNGALILPLKVDIDPYGFISKYQAYKLDNIQNACESIIAVLCDNQRLRNRVIELLIDRFRKSDNWAEAANRMTPINAIKNYSKKQANAVIFAAISNSQIYNSYKAQSQLVDFINQNETKLDKILISKLKKRFK